MQSGYMLHIQSGFGTCIVNLNIYLAISTAMPSTLEAARVFS